MLQDLFRPVADYWLFEGNKYIKSKELAGDAWDVNVVEALAEHDITLEGLTTPQQVADVFRGKWFWRPDPLRQLWDFVDPPQILLKNLGEDCDVREPTYV